LPIEDGDAVYDQLPDGIFPNMTYPKPKDSKSTAPWDSCTRLDVDFNDTSYFEGGVPAVHTVKCAGDYVYDTSKYETSARIDVRQC